MAKLFRSFHGVMVDRVTRKGRGHSTRHPDLVATVLLYSLLAACTHSGSMALPSQPDAKPLHRFTVLTYNTLHGLEPSGLTVKADESKAARQARLNLQLNQLSWILSETRLRKEE